MKILIVWGVIYGTVRIIDQAFDPATVAIPNSSKSSSKTPSTPLSLRYNLNTESRWIVRECKSRGRREKMVYMLFPKQ